MTGWVGDETTRDTTRDTTADATGYEELSSDIRLLGRLLGQVISDQAGPDTLHLIESIRRRAVHARRNGVSSVESLREALSDQPIEEQIHVIRAFDWLSLLANTAEDVHLERRRRFHRAAASTPQPGSLAATFDRLEAAGVAKQHVAEVIAELQVSPVITAHPTEVRRQTILDVLKRVALLLDEHSRLDDEDPGVTDIEHELELKILMLWQTAILRLSKLRVRDEINEALRYYSASLFVTVPELSRDLERIAIERGEPARPVRQTLRCNTCPPTAGWGRWSRGRRTSGSETDETGPAETAGACCSTPGES